MYLLTRSLVHRIRRLVRCRSNKQKNKFIKNKLSNSSRNEMESARYATRANATWRAGFCFIFAQFIESWVKDARPRKNGARKTTSENNDVTRTRFTIRSCGNPCSLHTAKRYSNNFPADSILQNREMNFSL